MHTPDATPWSRQMLAKAAVTLLLSSTISVCHGADAASINEYLRTGKSATALAKIDGELARNHGDPQLRFMKGLLLIQNGEKREAMNLLAKLIEDYPKLPEAYLSLASIHADFGEFDKALAILQRAASVSPTHDAAHESLGDLYLLLAARAFKKAVQLNMAGSGAKEKLAALRSSSFGNAENQSYNVQDWSTETIPPAFEARNEKCEAKVSDVEGTRADSHYSSDESDRDKRSILAALYDWLRAWNARDMDGYFSAYSKSFKPNNGKSMQLWMSERKSRILGKQDPIQVEIASPRIVIGDTTAVVRFYQCYSSGKLRTETYKTLVFRREASLWLIQREFSQMDRLDMPR